MYVALKIPCFLWRSYIAKDNGMQFTDGVNTTKFRLVRWSRDTNVETCQFPEGECPNAYLFYKLNDGKAICKPGKDNRIYQIYTGYYRFNYKFENFAFSCMVTSRPIDGYNTVWTKMGGINTYNRGSQKNK